MGEEGQWELYKCCLHVQPLKKRVFRACAGFVSLNFFSLIVVGGTDCSIFYLYNFMNMLSFLGLDFGIIINIGICHANGENEDVIF